MKVRMLVVLLVIAFLNCGSSEGRGKKAPKAVGGSRAASSSSPLRGGKTIAGPVARDSTLEIFSIEPSTKFTEDPTAFTSGKADTFVGFDARKAF